MKRIFPLILSLLVLAACAGKEEKKEKKRRFVDPSTISKEPPKFTPWVIEDSSKIYYTEGGVGVYIVEEGPGAKPEPLTPILVHYYGTLEDGTEFDNSYDRGEPYTYSFGTGNVIQGWNEGIATMNFGTKAILIIPPELAYGRRGSPPNIPPNATLIFHINLLGKY